MDILEISIEEDGQINYYSTMKSRTNGYGLNTPDLLLPPELAIVLQLSGLTSNSYNLISHKIKKDKFFVYQ